MLGIVLYGDWVKDPKEQIICCLDGLRPVVFKVEAYEE
ncbi:TIGR04076 family protein [Parablautia intestinalis]|uniref:TIGR04076 family protein n=1 Tax=Parablautia intestinalis TaxID=2320100 RepID=A0A3A9AEA1_9FIRM|nr:TIGR04076 family protein [Parablautia intestinalis]MDE7048839.1 TIGR04076 family protein [Lachnospiraceae bacterium]RKI89424.1 TIGR04076 family protein [Parablautia intestinalis]